jgi:ABC-type glycerol-3-phosphate transport system substrate-binding protein
MGKSKLASALCALLALCFFVSCAQDLPQTGGETAVTSDAAETAEFAEPDYPDKDYGGRAFNILYLEWGTYQHYFFADELTGESMNDTLHKRQTAVEEALNIEFTRQGVTGHYDVKSNLSASVHAGDGGYDLVLAHCYIPLTAMITENLLYNWYDIPFIDMAAVYWNSYNDRLAVNGILPYASSDYIITDPNSVFFNKDLVRAYNLRSPYDQVTGGQWTWTGLTEMARGVSEDLDGNGVFDENDQYGFMGELGWQFDGIRNAIGEKVVSVDTDGRLVINPYTEKTAEVVNQIYDLLYTDNTSFTWGYSEVYDPNHGGIPPVDFGQGQALFYLVPLSSARAYRATEVDFGILPFPKYDEAQERYITTNWSGLMCVPVTVTDPELVGIVCEMLAVEGRKSVRPAYYDVLLASKIARDNESVVMLDIIYDNCEYDLGLNYGGGNIWYMMSQLMTAKDTNIASFFEKNLKQDQLNLDKLHEAFLEYGA